MDRERPEMYEALGRTIQVLRTDQSLERKDLAERAGISYSYLAAIENGKKPPSSKVLFAIASALGLRSHELLASAETRVERSAVLHERARIQPPSQRARWFHAEPAVISAGRSAPAPYPTDDPADDLEPSAERGDLPLHRNVPRSAAGYLMELQRITADLDDHDREMVLDLARRLAGRRT